MDITLEQWHEQLRQDVDAVIIDVRTEEEVEAGHIAESLHIDIQNPAGFMEEVQKLNPEKSYYVYCRSGGRSKQACMVLQSLGFDKVYNLEVGYEGWIEGLDALDVSED